MKCVSREHVTTNSLTSTAVWKNRKPIISENGVFLLLSCFVFFFFLFSFFRRCSRRIHSRSDDRRQCDHGCVRLRVWDDHACLSHRIHHWCSNNSRWDRNALLLSKDFYIYINIFDVVSFSIPFFFNERKKEKKSCYSMTQKLDSKWLYFAWEIFYLKGFLFKISIWITRPKNISERKY